ncbi:unnamed protein product [Bursaphelenchus xylophilus]|uniref:(pine wood nematode) hypothetical protein n=1 Tax=Bursaphelenchus xylophilus TaxID=6326 RepID=A0A7I8XE14_BURXY|nr:unnamed protein product [Bursaphelenchus xylophilus]CAG9113877.1 unnamed protein product [Bursaphelenchus xylophilus]
MILTRDCHGSGAGSWLRLRAAPAPSREPEPKPEILGAAPAPEPKVGAGHLSVQKSKNLSDCLKNTAVWPTRLSAVNLALLFGSATVRVDDMIYFIAFLLILSTPLTHAINTNFNIELTYANKEARKVLVDTTSAASFLFDAKVNLDKSRTVNPADSKTFKNLNKTIFQKYNPYTNEAYSSFSGYLGEDDFSHGALKFRGTLGLASGQLNDPGKASNGELFAGRIGLSRGKSDALLRDAILAKAEKKVACLSLQTTIGGEKPTSKVTLRQDPFADKTPYLQAKSLPHPEGNWQVNVTRFSLAGVVFANTIPADISTTCGFIGVPYNYFAKIRQALNVRYDNKTGHDTVDCNKVGTFVLHINGKAFLLYSGYYTEKSGSVCVLKIRPQSGFVLGLPFFVNAGVCLDFEKEELKIYKLQTIKNKTGSN